MTRRRYLSLNLKIPVIISPWWGVQSGRDQMQKMFDFHLWILHKYTNIRQFAYIASQNIDFVRVKVSTWVKAFNIKYDLKCWGSAFLRLHVKKKKHVVALWFSATPHNIFDVHKCHHVWFGAERKDRLQVAPQPVFSADKTVNKHWCVLLSILYSEVETTLSLLSLQWRHRYRLSNLQRELLMLRLFRLSRLEFPDFLAMFLFR